MILLVGGTGFLGPSILTELLQKGYRINCLARVSSDRSELIKAAGAIGHKITFSSGNLQSSDSLIGPIKSSSIAVYMVDLKYTDYLSNFLDAVKRAAGLRRVVFISSTTVLTPLKNPVKEQKISSEQLIVKSGLDFTILRPSMIYGSENDPNFSKMIKFINKKGFFVTFGRGNNLIQPVYIEDVASAVSGVLENEKTFFKSYNLAGKSPLSYREMLNIVRSCVKKPFRIIYLPIGLSRFLVSVYGKFFKNSMLSAAQVERMGIDKTYSYREAANDFNFNPIDFQSGIERLIKKLDN